MKTRKKIFDLTILYCLVVFAVATIVSVMYNGVKLGGQSVSFFFTVVSAALMCTAVLAAIDSLNIEGGVL